MDINQIKKNISDSIKQNIENLIDSHLKYGGVYICVIEAAGENESDSLEVELDEGSIAFSLSIPENLRDEALEALDEALRGNSPSIGVYRERWQWEEALA